MRFLILAFILLTACSMTPARGPDVLAIGDSILAWNSFLNRDVPAQVAQKTGLRVESRARNGAQFLSEQGIPTQYEAGSYDWLILNGGGNDLGLACLRPRAAQSTLDDLIAADLSGAYADFLAQVRRDGAQVVILGYAPVSIRGGPFAACTPYLDELARRQARLAATLDGVVFVNSRDVIRADDLDAYAFDRVHPTAYAGDLMSDLIVAQIEKGR